jgi:hypothetical protein
MKEIPLTRGKVALVDDCDYDQLKGHNWAAVFETITPRWSAVRNDHHYVGDPHYTVKMHREILGIRDRRIHVDHINGDGLDNRRENLRTCTNAQNNMNSRKRRNARTSQYKGVHWRAKEKKWCVQLQVNHHKVYYGRFKDELEAGRAYDVAARKFFGKFARLNFPTETEMKASISYPIAVPKSKPKHQRSARKILSIPTTSQFKGVSWDKYHQKWRATIHIDNRQTEIGRYDNEIEAAKAYDRAARQFFGALAYVNFPK